MEILSLSATEQTLVSEALFLSKKTLGSHIALWLLGMIFSYLLERSLGFWSYLSLALLFGFGLYWHYGNYQAHQALKNDAALGQKHVQQFKQLEQAQSLNLDLSNLQIEVLEQGKTVEIHYLPNSGLVLAFVW